jgi:hypothetical protein
MKTCYALKIKNQRRYKENRARILADQKRRYKANPTAFRKKKLWYKWGISLEHYNDMLAEQRGVCAICKTKPTSRNLDVDHIHGTKPKALRGLLCPTCNKAIGLLYDSSKLCREAASYLEKYEHINF